MDLLKKGNLMFGYVIVNQPELKIKDFDLYRSFYCGLCETLQERHGRFAQLSLNFDMTFLSILLSALYESENIQSRRRCLPHPCKQHMTSKNEWVSYCADMTVILMYLKCKDDWSDERRHSSHMLSQGLKKHYEGLKRIYGEKILRMEQALQENDRLEKEHSDDLDALAACSGRMMGEICTPKQDEWSDSLHCFGDYLGRFIYLMDAYDDLPKDIEKNRFNPLISRKDDPNFECWIREVLEMMIANSAQVFEKLPIIRFEDIIRNILYSGVWAKYEVIRKKRSGEDDA